MAENDIYNNKRYEKYMTNINRLCVIPEKAKKGATRKYFIKNLPISILLSKELRVNCLIFFEMLLEHQQI
ncbi:MAG: hypothetical protein AABW49_04415 [Nanoarchaeota archaeon]